MTTKPEPKCECVGCDLCQGEGTVLVETDSYPDREVCSECGGGGTIRTCDYCRESEAACEPLLTGGPL